MSEDGINWVKPRLGLYEYNGNKDNNICLPACGAVIKDHGEQDPDRRYKMVTRRYPDGSAEGVCRVIYSGDGIHWKPGARIDLPEWKGGLRENEVLLVRSNYLVDYANRVAERFCKKWPDRYVDILAYHTGMPPPTVPYIPT